MAVVVVVVVVVEEVVEVVEVVEVLEVEVQVEVVVVVVVVLVLVVVVVVVVAAVAVVVGVGVGVGVGPATLLNLQPTASVNTLLLMPGHISQLLLRKWHHCGTRRCEVVVQVSTILGKNGAVIKNAFQLHGWHICFS